MKAQVVGGPEDGRAVDIDPFKRSIVIFDGAKGWECPVRDRRIYWNERKPA